MEMTDEQLLRLICDHTGKRINLPNFTLDELKDFARAVLAAAAPTEICQQCGATWWPHHCVPLKIAPRN